MLFTNLAQQTDRALGLLWGDVVLQPAEADVTSAVRLIEPRVEQITFAPRRSGSGFYVRLKQEGDRQPLGTLGEGVRRMLTLALHLASARGGVVLLDDIEAGLHHGRLTDMWRMVTNTAKRVGCQVFATTHSLDCINALGELRRTEPALAADIAVHRVERESRTTVRYDPEDVEIATRQQIEVR